MIKYLLKPGYVISKTDGQRHYISARKLVTLYNVNPDECTTNDIGIKNLIVLEPRYDGNYIIPLNQKEILKNLNRGNRLEALNDK